MKLMGVDGGFSRTRLTTGIACLDGDQLRLVRTGTAWEIRHKEIPRGFEPTIGDATGGWFLLPPWSLWQPWAKQGFDTVARAMALKGQPLE